MTVPMSPSIRVMSLLFEVTLLFNDVNTVMEKEIQKEWDELIPYESDDPTVALVDIKFILKEIYNHNPNLLDRIYKDDFDHVQEVKISIMKHGFKQPVIASYETGSFKLMDGWHRMVCARELDILEIPVRYYQSPPPTPSERKSMEKRRRKLDRRRKRRLERKLSM